MKSPRFTIITPVFNGESYLRQTILSVLQFAPNQRYIVVDDGSTDNTSKILAEYSDRLIIISQQNSGEANAVNAGIFATETEFGMIVCADDPLFDERLFTLSAEVFDRDPHVVATYPDWRVIDSNGYPVRSVQTDNYSEATLIGKFTCIPGPGAAFRIHSAKSIGGRDAQYKYVSDYDFWLRLSRLGTFIRIPEELAQWREHQGSTSITSRGPSMARERIQVMDDFCSRNAMNKKLTRRARSSSRYHAALLAYFDDAVPGRKIIIDSLKIAKGYIPGADFRIILFLLFLPYSQFLLKLLKRIPLYRVIGRKNA